jgi:uncharacterized protein YbaR (Trm112 family)
MPSNMLVICPSTHQEYRIDESDVFEALESSKGVVSETVLTCPDCGNKVTFESNQMAGSHLYHKI